MNGARPGSESAQAGCRPGAPWRRLLLGWLLLLALPLVQVACTGGASQGPAPVAPATPDFALAAAPAQLTVAAGGTGYLVVTITRLNGHAEPIQISVPGLPAGVTASGIAGASAGSLHLPIVVAPGVQPVALSGLTVQGVSGSLTRTLPITLTVLAEQQPSEVGTDLVQSSGQSNQTSGSTSTLGNTAVAGEPVVASESKNDSGFISIRHGFRPYAQ